MVTSSESEFLFIRPGPPEQTRPGGGLPEAFQILRVWLLMGYWWAFRLVLDEQNGGSQFLYFPAECL